MRNKKLLFEKRKEIGLKAERIAKDLNISRRTLYRKEDGQVRLTEEDVSKFSKYYKIRKKEIRDHYEVKDGKGKRNNKL